jgi:hypothetical protein
MLPTRRGERGQSLVIVLSLITLFFLLGSALAVHASVALRATRTSEGQGDEFYAADAATELGIWWQRNGKVGNPPAQTINGITTSTTITSVPGGGGGGCPASSPTPIWMQGFESGIIPYLERFTATPGMLLGSSGTGLIDSSTVRTGSYSMSVSPAGSGSSVALQFNYGVPFNATVTVEHFAMRLAALPAADAVVSHLIANGNEWMWLYYKQSTGKWTVALGGTWAGRAEVQSSVSAVAGQWHTFDFKFQTSVDPVVVDWYVDGSAQPQLTNPAGGATSVVHAGWGQTSLTTSATYTGYYDDIMLSGTAADFPLGDVRISALKPNAMGTHNTPANYQNDDSTALNATSWQRVDEIPMSPSATTDYIKEITAGSSSYAEIAFADTTQTCVRGASIFFGVHAAGAQNNNVGVVGVTNGVSYTILNGNIANTGVRYAQRVTSQSTTLAGVGPWTQAIVNGITARFGYSTDVAPIPYLDSIVLEYAWLNPVATPATVTIAGSAGGSTVNTSYSDAGAAAPTLSTWTTTK